jgi:RNA polymerase sigma factor (sigma-70 family)
LDTLFEDINSPEFVVELQKGSIPAFEKLVDRLLSPLQDFLRLGQNLPDGDAEEMAADVLMIVHKRIGTFRHGKEAKLTTWIFTIAKNRAIDHHRSIQPEYVDLADEQKPFAGNGGGIFAGRNRQLVTWLLNELDGLSSDDRELLKWRAIGYSYAQISEWLAIAENTARARHKRALDKLIAKSEEMAILKGAAQP